jgi:molybdenum cofactor cytidylyltransferase
MKQRSSSPVVRVCVLAAGTSSRFGDTKLVQCLRGKPLIQHALLAAQGACAGSVVLVVGHDQDAVTSASGGLSDGLIVNPDYREGIGSSIAAGVRGCRGGADAVLIMLADQPLVTTAHLNEIIDTWSGADNEIIASSFDNVFGPPILFPGSSFDTLSALTGDDGAKKLLADDKFNVKSVEFMPAGMDVDTPDDLNDLDQD